MSNTDQKSILAEMGALVEITLFMKMLDELKTVFELGEQLLLVSKERGEESVADREKVRDGVLAVIDAISISGTAISNMMVNRVDPETLRRCGLDPDSDPLEALVSAAADGREKMRQRIERAYAAAEEQV